LTTLKNVRRNDSLRPKYEVIANQGVVLLVSYFSSSLEDLFRVALADALDARRIPEELWDAEFKASFAQLVGIRRDADGLIDLVVAKNDINFQDMQSIVRSFKDYLRIQVIKDTDTDNLIFAQAARHAIVHSAGIADDRFLKQIRFAPDRAISRPFAKGDRIQFSTDEVLLTGAAMLRFVGRVGKAICADLSAPA
jgi:hypothetical protein